MIKIEAQLVNLRHLDELATGNTVIHRLNPCAKLLTTMVFIIVVTSFPKQMLAGLIPLCIFPVALVSLGDLPVSPLARRVVLTLPFIIFIGIFNPLLDHSVAFQIGDVAISNGWISFFSILTRSILAVSAALLLVATTGMEGICAALYQIKVPKVLVIQLLFMYRYLYILLEEVGRTIQAYNLRSFEDTGIGYKAAGSLVGQLLMRTLDRAQRIYVAMRCRGFDGNIRLNRQTRVQYQDVAFAFGWSAFFIFARIVNIPQWLGSLLTEGYR